MKLTDANKCLQLKTKKSSVLLVKSIFYLHINILFTLIKLYVEFANSNSKKNKERR